MRKDKEQAELDVIHLTEEDKVLLQEYAASLDPTNSNSLLLYGTDIQKNLAQLAHILLGNLDTTGVDSTGEQLQRTVDYLDAIENEEDKNVVFWRKKAKGLRLQNKYDEACADVERIEAGLTELHVKLLMDNTMLDQLCKMNEQYYRQLMLKIQGAKMKIKELREKKGDENFCQRIERKIVDLEMTKLVASQQASQLQILQNNAASMAEGLQSVLYHIIPLWKSSIASARGAQQAIQADNTQRKLNNRKLRESLGEISRLRQEALEKKTAAEKEFSQMESKMESEEESK